MAMESTSGSSLMRPRTNPKAVPDCRRASAMARDGAREW